MGCRSRADLVASLFTLLILPQHGFSSDLIVPIFEKYNQRGYYVAISEADSHKNLGIHLRPFTKASICCSWGGSILRGAGH